MVLKIRQSPKNYFKSTGRSGTGGRFSRPQTGGQAAVDALRRQAEPEIRYLRQQQIRTDEYNRDIVNAWDRNDRLEEGVRAKNQQLTESVEQLAIRNTLKRGDLEYKAAMGKATEYGKEATYWKNFSTTYAKEWAKLAEGAATFAGNMYAYADFKRIHEEGKTAGLIPEEDPGNVEFEAKRDEVISEVQKVLTQKEPLTDEQKEYVKANLKLIGSTSWELQQKLVQHEIDNAENRFDQMRELLGEEYNPEDAKELASRLAFLVSVRSGITNPALQHKLFLAYTKKANAKAHAAYNVRHSAEMEETKNKHVQNNINLDRGQLNTVLSSYKAQTNKHNGTPQYGTWRETLDAYIEDAIEAGVDPDRLLPYILEENIPGSTTVTWGMKYKGKGAISIQESINEAVIKKQKKDVQDERTRAAALDLKQSQIYASQYNAFKLFKQSGLSPEEWRQQNPDQEYLDPDDPKLVTMMGAAAQGSNSRKVLSTIYANSQAAKNSRYSQEDVLYDIRNGNIAEAEHKMEAYDFSDDQKKEFRRKIAEWPLIVKDASWILNDSDINTWAKSEIKSVLSKGKIPRIDTLVDSSAGEEAQDLLMQSVRYYFWDEPEVAGIKDPMARLQKARELALVDLQAGQGLWWMAPIEPDSVGDMNLLQVFPELSSKLGFHQWNVMNDTEFNKLLLSKETKLRGSKTSNERTWWLRTPITWMQPQELSGYATKVLRGASDEIVYSPRVIAIAKQLGPDIHPFMVVNILLEEDGYTERIPIDLSAVVSDKQKIFLLENKDKFSTKFEEESIESRMLSNPGKKVRGGRYNPTYASQATLPTKLLYYEFLEAIRLMKEKEEEVVQ